MAVQDPRSFREFQHDANVFQDVYPGINHSQFNLSQLNDRFFVEKYLNSLAYSGRDIDERA